MPIQADQTQSRTILSQSVHPAGAHYLALLADGRVRPGRSESTARAYQVQDYAQAR